MKELKTSPEFLIDGMLKGLTKWLRVLGFSSLYLKEFSKISEFLDNNPHVRFITGSPKHWQNIPHPQKLLITSNSLHDQIQDVNREYAIFEKMNPFTVCLSCNTYIQPITKKEIPDSIPDRIRQSFEQFWKCPACQRIYWHGGHVERMINRLRSIQVPLDFKIKF